jgi:hypothetical protein
MDRGSGIEEEQPIFPQRRRGAEELSLGGGAGCRRGGEMKTGMVECWNIGRMEESNPVNPVTKSLIIELT